MESGNICYHHTICLIWVQDYQVESGNHARMFSNSLWKKYVTFPPSCRNLWPMAAQTGEGTFALAQGTSSICQEHTEAQLKQQKECISLPIKHLLPNVVESVGSTLAYWSLQDMQNRSGSKSSSTTHLVLDLILKRWRGSRKICGYQLNKGPMIQFCLILAHCIT